jgi:hypothetical protein
VRVILAALAVLTGMVLHAQIAEAGPCDNPAAPPQVVIECESHTTGSTSHSASATDTADGTAYEYEWLSACSAVTPANPSARTIGCEAMHTCQNRALVLLALWGRQVTDRSGRASNKPWAFLKAECRAPSDMGPVRRQVGWVDVVNAVRRVGIPAGDLHAPHLTLVNLETTFYTRPHQLDRVLTILGYSVDVEVHPTHYTWHWGDGTSQTTETPGRPYPSLDVTHTYRHATEPDHDLALSVDVTYAGRYRVDGTAWTAIPQPITISGPPTALPVKQASAVLVTND